MILFWLELHITFIHFGLHPDQDLILFEPLDETLQTPNVAFREQIHRWSQYDGDESVPSGKDSLDELDLCSLNPIKWVTHVHNCDQFLFYRETGVTTASFNDISCFWGETGATDKEKLGHKGLRGTFVAFDGNMRTSRHRGSFDDGLSEAYQIHYRTGNVCSSQILVGCRVHCSLLDDTWQDSQGALGNMGFGHVTSGGAYVTCADGPYGVSTQVVASHKVQVDRSKVLASLDNGSQDGRGNVARAHPDNTCTRFRLS